jgi:1-acyl-sn-glycerol-3-phosphate acyltransferase
LGKIFYRIAVPLVKLFIPRLEVQWEVPDDGEPCIFVANHERATGPLEMAANFPLRQQSHIWIYAAPLSRKTTPEYVRQDHWWDENGKLAPLWNAVIPPIVSLILPPILRSAPHVPVYHDGRAATTMKESLRLLQSGKNLVIFPEIPTGFGEHDPEKINEGWLMMLPMYEKRAGKSLKIRPVRLDLAEKRMIIRAPFGMNPDVPLRDQVPELSRKVLQGIFESEERKENT